MRQKTIRKVKYYSEKVWSLDKADKIFSNQIRERDGVCQFPGCEVTDPKKLQNSHYISRARYNTRFDRDNCIALCWRHHYKDKLLGYEYQKQMKEKHGYDGQYTKMMRKRLGYYEFLNLVVRGIKSVKQKDAIIAFMSECGQPYVPPIK